MTLKASVKFSIVTYPFFQLQRPSFENFGQYKLTDEYSTGPCFGHNKQLLAETSKCSHLRRTCLFHCLSCKSGIPRSASLPGTISRKLDSTILSSNAFTFSVVTPGALLSRSTPLWALLRDFLILFSSIQRYFGTRKIAYPADSTRFSYF